MYQNPLSYVWEGKDNSGAAQHIPTYDSSRMWDKIDKIDENIQRKVKARDDANKSAYGDKIDFKSGGVHPNDIPEIQKSINNTLNKHAQYVAKAKQERRSLLPEEIADIQSAKIETENLLQLAQRQYKDYNTTLDEIQKDPYGYSDNARTVVGSPFSKEAYVPIMQRDYIGVDRLAPGTSMAWLKSNSGQPWTKQERGTKRADGSFRDTQEYIFDEAQARKDYRERIVPQYGTKEGRIYVSSLKPDLELVAKQKYNTDFASLPQATQAEIMDEVGEENYVNFMRSQMPKESSIKTGAAPLDKEKGTGKDKGSASTLIDDQPLIRRVYAPYKGEERVIKGTGEGDKYELLDVLEFPVTGLYGSKGPAEERQLYWEDEAGAKHYGDLITIKQYRDQNDSWGDTMWGTIQYEDANGNPVEKEIKMSGYNKKQFKTEFGYDPQEARDRKYQNWKEQFEEKLAKIDSEDSAPEKDPFWSTYSDKKKKAISEAYMRALQQKEKRRKIREEISDPDAKYQRK